MRYRRVLLFAAATFGLTAVLLQTGKAEGPPTRLNMSITSSTIEQPFPGTCAGVDPNPNAGLFEGFCPSGNPSTNCQCIIISNAKVTGTLKGTATLYITEDLNAPTDSQLTNNCLPFFGGIDVNVAATKLGEPETATLNLVGADCNAITAIGPETLSGGFGITVPPATAGYGSLNGTVNSSGVVRLTLHGPLTGFSASPSPSGSASPSPTPPISISAVGHGGLERFFGIPR
jgi:hypothetical protein